jgi:hypothetical protein
MHRKFAALLIAVACVASVACSKDSEVESVTNELHTFSQELIKKVETSGVDEAQKFMDSRKEDLKAKMNSIKNVRSAQLKKETQEKFATTITQDAMEVGKLKAKFIGKDAASNAKIDKLISDYSEIFKLQ